MIDEIGCAFSGKKLEVIPRKILKSVNAVD